MSLKDARIKRDELQTARAKGEKISRKDTEQNTFENVVYEWLKVRMQDKAASYLKKMIGLRLKKYILPVLGAIPITEITSKDILQICRQIEDEGHDETARRIKIITGQFFRFAVASGLINSDPTSALHEALRPMKREHYPTFTNPSEITILMRAVKNYPYTTMRCAILFSIYTVARPGEIRAAEWTEVNGDTWEIPAEKMKMRCKHIIS